MRMWTRAGSFDGAPRIVVAMHARAGEEASRDAVARCCSICRRRCRVLVAAGRES
jgi:hypothetical protein